MKLDLTGLRIEVTDAIREFVLQQYYMTYSIILQRIC